MTPQRHVRNWLHNHNTSAIELSLMVGKGAAYVSTFLCRSGGNPGAIIVLDKKVHFPPWILQAAIEKRDSRKSKPSSHNTLRWHMDLIMAWKAPKGVA